MKRTNSIDLKFAAKDAQDFVTAAEAQQGGLYERVIVQRLLNKEARSEAILDELDWLRREVTNNDVAMVYFSGHGIQGEEKGTALYPMTTIRIELTALRLLAMIYRDFLGRSAARPLFSWTRVIRATSCVACVAQRLCQAISMRLPTI